MLREDHEFSNARVAQLLEAHGFAISGAAVAGWQRGEFAPRTMAVVKALEEILNAKGELLPLLRQVDEDGGVSARLQNIEDRLDRLATLEARVDKLEGRRRRPSQTDV